MRSHTLVFQLETKRRARIEKAKNRSCLMKIEYVEPDCCNETTLDAERTITIPKADRKVKEPRIM